MLKISSKYIFFESSTRGNVRYIVSANVFPLPKICTTWSAWNLLIAVGVLRSLGQELDPVLYFSHPGIHAMAGALAAIAHHTNLRQSQKCMKLMN